MRWYPKVPLASTASKNEKPYVNRRRTGVQCKRAQSFPLVALQTETYYLLEKATAAFRQHRMRRARH